MANNNSELGMFFSLIQQSLYFQSVPLTADAEVFDLVIGRLEDLGHDIEPLMEYTTIYWVYMILNTKDFHQHIADTFDRKLITKDDIFHFRFNNETDSCFIFEIIKDKTKKTRKTLQEHENDLEVLIKEEKFEEAAKLRNKIDKLRVQIETKKNKVNNKKK